MWEDQNTELPKMKNHLVTRIELEYNPERDRWFKLNNTLSIKDLYDFQSNKQSGGERDSWIDISNIWPHKVKIIMLCVWW